MGIIYYKGGLILYKKFLKGRRIKAHLKIIYMLNLTSFYKEESIYTLNEKLSLKMIISASKKLIDDCNKQTKI